MDSQSHCQRILGSGSLPDLAGVQVDFEQYFVSGGTKEAPEDVISRMIHLQVGEDESGGICVV